VDGFDDLAGVDAHQDRAAARVEVELAEVERC
jgi:hypothetical protein